MTAYPAWTPASRPGIIPLHPLTFGTILGRSFVALRHNPRVLLGFALGIQALAYTLMIVGIGGVAWLTFSRLDTVRPGSDEFEAIMAGSIALTAVTGFVLGLLTGVLSTLVQGVVVSEVAHAVVAEKLTLRMIWQRVKPVVWRLIGYSLLLTLAVVLLVAVVVGALVAIGFAALPVAIGLTVVVILTAIPLTLWISTKLLLVPATIIIEHATIFGAIARAWRLIRGRFWPALGIIVLISFLFGAIAQAVSIPLSLLSSGLTTVISPTGDPEPGTLIAILIGALLTQIITFAIQAVAVVVQATATSLIYIDCRMRREGLDLDLLAYVEKRDAGATSLPDPYREHVGRELAPRLGTQVPPPYPTYPPTYTGYPPAPGYAPAPGYPQPGPGYPPPAPGYAAPPPGYGPPAPAYPPAPPAPPAAPSPDAPPTPTRWTAPGTDGIDPESPWA